jgi:hypothetical protein
MPVNREGYQVIHATIDGPRTYACSSRYQVISLVSRLVGVPAKDFKYDIRDVPVHEDIKIAFPLHIYTD